MQPREKVSYNSQIYLFEKYIFQKIYTDFGESFTMVNTTGKK